MYHGKIKKALAWTNPQKDRQCSPISAFIACLFLRCLRGGSFGQSFLRICHWWRLSRGRFWLFCPFSAWSARLMMINAGFKWFRRVPTASICRFLMKNYRSQTCWHGLHFFKYRDCIDLSAHFWYAYFKPIVHDEGQDTICFHENELIIPSLSCYTAKWKDFNFRPLCDSPLLSSQKELWVLPIF